MCQQIQNLIKFGKTFCNLCKKVLLDVAVPLAKYVLPKLVTKATSSMLDNLKQI